MIIDTLSLTIGIVVSGITVGLLSLLAFLYHEYVHTKRLNEIDDSITAKLVEIDKKVDEAIEDRLDAMIGQRMIPKRKPPVNEREMMGKSNV